MGFSKNFDAAGHRFVVNTFGTAIRRSMREFKGPGFFWMGWGNSVRGIPLSERLPHFRITFQGPISSKNWTPHSIFEEAGPAEHLPAAFQGPQSASMGSSFDPNLVHDRLRCRGKRERSGKRGHPAHAIAAVRGSKRQRTIELLEGDPDKGEGATAWNSAAIFFNFWNHAQSTAGRQTFLSGTFGQPAKYRDPRCAVHALTFHL